MGARLFAYVSYPDGPAALDWLAAVGFVEVRRQDDATGAVVHAELRLGDAVVMVASDDAAYQRPPLVGRSTGSGVYLLVEEPAAVDAFTERARAAGARVVVEPEDTPWGSRRARVLDPQGREWTLGTYEPGAAW
ncbi:VOC family protein [Cellulomonas sp. PS-H5]|uniref:VOC family protein n=1 Tax=Cellulomonas sp. PS-H5 TaxID=2820400 RepID=UPI001C4FFCC5|nr:VOC family protein [Cellulomonas sp. PS-H5]MBW0252874.1 VOC family protein [Cellulomonas sp. PS-H5]